MNKIMLLPYLDILDPERQKVFKLLKHFGRTFVLGGGTAIMLQIGHRLSYDFDCFSEKPLPKNTDKIAYDIFGKDIAIQVQTRDQITLVTPTNVEITFVCHPYKSLEKVIRTDSIPLFHLNDLAANKAITIGKRGTWRDYVDLFFLLRNKLYSMETLIALAEQKFAGMFSEKLFLEQLVYFDDLDIAITAFIKESYKEKEIKSFLEKQVEEYIRKRIH